MTNGKVLLSLFDHSGNQSEPYRLSWPEWDVIQVDIKHGYDFFKFDILQIVLDNPGCKFGIIAPVPCTAYALSGNRHKKTEARKEISRTKSLTLVTLRVI